MGGNDRMWYDSGVNNEVKNEKVVSDRCSSLSALWLCFPLLDLLSALCSPLSALCFLLSALRTPFCPPLSVVCSQIFFLPSDLLIALCFPLSALSSYLSDLLSALYFLLSAFQSFSLALLTALWQPENVSWKLPRGQTHLRSKSLFPGSKNLEDI